MINDEEKRRLQLQALQNLRDRRLDKAQKARVDTSDASVNLAKGDLDKDVLKVTGDSTGADVSEPVTRLKTGTDEINTKGLQKLSDVEEFAERNAKRSLKGDLRSSFKAAVDAGDNEMMSKLRKIASKMGQGAKTGLKSIPLVGGIAAATLGGASDASAAIPVLDSADSAGMSSSDENQMLAEIQAKKDYGQSEARKAALAKLAKSGQ